LLSAGEATLLAAPAKFRLVFAGANRGARITGEQQLSERRNYLLGNDCAKWQTDVPTFRRVTYEDIYPGIDLTYYGNHHEIEYDFVIAPGSNPSAIRLAFDRDRRQKDRAER
jgi:hypothetical protein